MTRTRGASLVEVLAVVTVLAIVAVSAAVGTAGGPEQQAEALARGVRARVERARELAVRSGKPVAVVFGGQDLTIVDEGSGDPLPPWILDGPAMADLRVLAGSPGAIIGGTSFGGDRVVFGPDGAPQAGGTVLLRVGMAARTVRVFPVTGRVRVDEPTTP